MNLNQASHLLAPFSTREMNPVSNRFWIAPSRKLSLQRCVSSSSIHYPKHTHAEYTVVVCFLGSLHVEQNGALRVADEGEALISNAGFPHESTYFTDRERCESVSLAVSVDFMKQAIADVCGSRAAKNPQPLFLLNARSRAVYSIASQIRDELSDFRSFNDPYLDQLGHRLIAAILRAQPPSDTHELDNAPPQPLLHRWQHVKAHEFMLKSSKEDFSIQRIARELGISPARFHVRFRSTTGVSPGQYFGELTMSKASRMLGDTSLQVKEISYELGFCSPSHFCKAFKRRFGISPLDFRQLLIGDQIQ